jgi:S-methylmethionine-dependent homocysteine/selenocysteine methylase
METPPTAGRTTGRHSPLREMLAGCTPLLLDGAMGTELQRRGVDIRTPLWSAGGVANTPDVVIAIHRESIAAGADIITTCTFRTTRRTFRHAGLPDISGELTARAIALAREAILKEPGRQVLIAGSVAPLEDCYRPDLVPPDHVLHEEHRELCCRLAGAGVDLLLLETMGTIREAAAACEQAVATGKDTVVSFICADDRHLLGGEPVTDAVRSLLPLHPAALSVNCIPPRQGEPLIRRIREQTDLPIAIYANVGREGERHGAVVVPEVTPSAYARWVRRWHDAGASIIGGCCGTTPEHVRAVHALFRSHPSTHRRSL